MVLSLLVVFKKLFVNRRLGDTDLGGVSPIQYRVKVGNPLPILQFLVLLQFLFVICVLAQVY